MTERRENGPLQLRSVMDLIHSAGSGGETANAILMKGNLVRDGRGLIPVVGAAMAAVAAGSLVMFSLLAQRTALSPGVGVAIAPQAGPPVHKQVLDVPGGRVRAPSQSAVPVTAPSSPEDAIAQTGSPEGTETQPDEVLVASVDVALPATRDAGPRRFPRPRIVFARNLNPPGPEDEEEDPEEDPDEEPTEDPPTEDPTENPTGGWFEGESSYGSPNTGILHDDSAPDEGEI